MSSFTVHPPVGGDAPPPEASEALCLATDGDGANAGGSSAVTAMPTTAAAAEEAAGTRVLRGEGEGTSALRLFRGEGESTSGLRRMRVLRRAPAFGDALADSADKVAVAARLAGGAEAVDAAARLGVRSATRLETGTAAAVGEGAAGVDEVLALLAAASGCVFGTGGL